MAYSKVAKKDQVTIPSRLRERHGFEERVIVAFKETKQGVTIESVPDVTESAGKLSKFGAADDVVRDLFRSREREFR